MHLFYNDPQVAQVARFLIAGGLGLGVNLLGFYLLEHVFSMPYVAASVLALSFSTIVGFFLQKYWTFRHRQSEQTARQFALYVIVALGNLGVDAVVVYTMVDVLLLQKLLAQATAAGTVAVWSYFLYKNILFVEKSN